MKKKIKSNKILVVDDDQEFLEELTEFLSSSGYTVVAINNPLVALAALVKVKPDVVLLDLKMPAKSGFQLAAEIRALPDFFDVPIVTMSAFVKDESTAFLSICGINKYIKKPFSPAQLVSDIEAVLSKQRLGLKVE